MPTYTFKNLETGEVWEEFLSISEREEKLKDPNIQQQVGAPAISYRGAGTHRKPDEGFRDVLRTIKKGTPRSTINTF